MKKKINIFILSLKNSPRLQYLVKKLKKLNLNYKIFYGIEGKNQKEKKIIYSNYNKERVVKYFGREMGFHEIGCTYNSIRVMRYAVRRKLKNIIILTDDFYPSYLLKEWIDNKIYFSGDKIIQFFPGGHGFLKKKKISFLKNKINVHFNKTHFSNPCGGQFTIGFMKKYLKITKGKVIGPFDYPFSLSKYKIDLMQTVPFLGIENDYNFSYLREGRNMTIDNNYNKIMQKIKIILYQKLKLKTNNLILEFLISLYYIFFIPFLFGQIKNLSFYYEFFFYKNFCKIKNILFNSYINIEKILTLESSYPQDLKKFVLKK
jgi:GR25 family glycosyltransferase involved in LPS biosynthesis